MENKTTNKKKTATLRVQKRKTVPLPTLADTSGNPQHISVFLQKPAGRHCMLNTKALQKVEELGNDVFRCYLPKVEFLNFEVCPIIDLMVTATEDDCMVELLSCKFEGSDAIESQNDRFNACLKNHLTWTTQLTEEVLNVNLDLAVELEVYTLPFTLLPVSAVETPGNMIMQAMVDRLLPSFLDYLFKDYKNWVEECAFVESY